MVKSKMFMFTAIIIASFMMLTELASPAWAQNVTVTCAPPPKAGSITLSTAFNSVPPGREWAVCTSTTAIPAGITAAQKAALIQAKHLNDCGGLNVTRVGAILTISRANCIVECWGAIDSTGEILLVDNDGIGFPVKYVTSVSLNGTSTNGTAMFSENGISKTVVTNGKTNYQIYTAWRSLFGEGTVTSHGFYLPERSTGSRSFGFEVTDPGLTITVNQPQTISKVPIFNGWWLLMGIFPGLFLILRRVRRS